MISYLIKRVGQAIAVVILSSFLVFGIMHWLPGDPILMYMTSDVYHQHTQAEIDQMRHEYGLDRPVVVQYGEWLGNALTGDFGKSITKGTTVADDLKQALPVSIDYGAVAFIIAHLIGIPLGIVCAVRRGKWLDNVITALANLGMTVPVFWLGILLIYLFVYKLHWLPIGGYTSPFSGLGMSLKQLILPAFCLALVPLAGSTRQTRSAMLDIIHQDYIRTAWAKGLRERAVVMKHVIRNGILPVVTLSGMAIPMVIGGSVLVENVFNLPGMGQMATTALFNKDYAEVQGVVLVVAIVVVFMNLLVDISYGYLDPRVRVS
jgi:peptide/nickel transport system permease protein